MFWRAMERDDSFAACGAMVRARDADRYFAALFAPKETRGALFALYALNYELAHVGESVREPMVGDIRMQWWRETLESARDGHPRAHVVAHALAAAMAAQDLPGDLFERMIEARGFDYLDGYFTDCAELESYAADTAGALMQLALRAAGATVAKDEAALDEAAREAGIAYALCGLLRALPHHAARRKLYLPLDVLAAHAISPEDIFSGRDSEGLRAAVAAIAARARAHLDAARALGRPGAKALPVFLPLGLVPLYLKQMAAPDFNPFRMAVELPLYRRQWRYLTAALSGRV